MAGIADNEDIKVVAKRSLDAEKKLTTDSENEKLSYISPTLQVAKAQYAWTSEFVPILKDSEKEPGIILHYVIFFYVRSS